MSHILLVDDDTDMIKLTERWLIKAGYEVGTATSGEDAINYLKTNTPDLILLDYAMPGMDGPATLEAIRADHPDILVYFRTGKDDTDIEEMCAKYNANGVISKADGKPKLLEAVTAALG